MEAAIRDVESGTSVRTAARQYGIPRNTLKRRVLHKNKKVHGSAKGLGHSQCLPKELELELVHYLKEMEARLFGLTKKEVCKLAYEIAEQNNIKNPFNKDQKRAGDDWFQSFLERHPDLSLRVPEATSAARAQGFNRPVVSKFFEVLEQEFTTNKIHPSRIYNCDETGIQTSHKPGKIIATKGRKQVGSLTSCDRGVNTTAVVAMSATGHFIPPMLIFARKRFKAELMDDTSAGTIGVCREKGWMDSELFLEFLKHFTRFVHCSPNNKVLLLLDGHCSHKTLEAIEYCRSNGIILICFPAHCTHRMQPLDVGFFSPVMTYYNQEVSLWLKNHPGRIVTQFQVGGLFSKAFERAASVLTAKRAFESTGIVPLNPNIFPDYMFAPSETTDRPVQAGNGDSSVTIHDASITMDSAVAPSAASTAIVCSQKNTAPALSIPQQLPENVPNANQFPAVIELLPTSVPTTPRTTAEEHADGCIPANSDVASDHVAVPLISHAVVDANDMSLSEQPEIPGTHEMSASSGQKRTHVGPFDISPLPTANRDEKPRRKRLAATLLTASPFLQELKEAARTKIQKESKKQSRKSLFPQESRAQEKPRNRKCQQKKGQTKKTKGTISNANSDATEEELIPCTVCGIQFLQDKKKKNGRAWISCMICSNWYHNECQGLDNREKPNSFVCISCNDC